MKIGAVLRKMAAQGIDPQQRLFSQNKKPPFDWRLFLKLSLSQLPFLRLLECYLLGIAVALHIYNNRITGSELSPENALRQRVLDLRLDQPP